MKTRVILVFFSILFSISTLKVNAAQCTSLGNGDWSDPANWSCGKAPDCGDTVFIAAGHNVQITSQIDLTACPLPLHLVIDGALDFTTGNKLSLPCNSSIQVNAGGQIYKSTPGGGNSTLICIECGGSCDDVWLAGSGPLVGPASIGSGLPIELIYFAVQSRGNEVIVTWVTLSEINNWIFSLERSTDGEFWENVKNIPGAGNSTQVLNYTFTDESPLSGTSYYRLKQTDFDGTYTYSKIVAVSHNPSFVNISVYPNPTQDELFITIEGFDMLQAELAIYSSTGRLVDAQILSGERMIFSTGHLPSGNYFVKLISKYDVLTKKFVKL